MTTDHALEFPAVILDYFFIQGNIVFDINVI